MYRPSASLIPNDPTLLLTNAGMVPFKPFFLGEEDPPYKRAVSIQKCARTIDIDIIGTTHRHLSFFEMMGNFSFGDYFKEQAIAWAYELVTSGYGLDPDRLWYTVHETDDEARSIWIDQVGIPSERVQKGGNDNFWQMGVAGPVRPLFRTLLRQGPRVRRRGRPDRRRRGALRRDLEPGLHAEHPGRAVPRDRGPARQEHRHRHGPRADGRDPPGGRLGVRDRRHSPDPRRRLRSHRRRLRVELLSPTSPCGSWPTMADR